MLKLMQRYVIFTTLFAMPLGGCSSYSVPPSNDEDNKNVVMLTTEEAIEFNKNKAKLDKIAAMESDLSVLLQELAKHANINENPSGFRHSPKEVRVAADYSVADDEATLAFTDENTFTVVLGRYLSKPAAQVAVDDMKRRYKFSALYVPIGIGVEDEYKDYYSVVLGNFASRSSAVSLCQAFSRLKQYCTAVPQITKRD